MRRSRRAFALLSLAVMLSPFAGVAATGVHVSALLSSHHSRDLGHGHGDAHDTDHHDHLIELVAYDNATHDNNDDHDHAADFQRVWHGHQHDKTTPEHGHPSAFASPPASLGPAAPRLIPHHGAHTIEYASEDVASIPSAGRAVLGRPALGLSPPPAEPPTILRV